MHMTSQNAPKWHKIHERHVIDVEVKFFKITLVLPWETKIDIAHDFIIRQFLVLSAIGRVEFQVVIHFVDGCAVVKMDLTKMPLLGTQSLVPLREDGVCNSIQALCMMSDHFRLSLVALLLKSGRACPFRSAHVRLYFAGPVIRPFPSMISVNLVQKSSHCSTEPVSKGDKYTLYVCERVLISRIVTYFMSCHIAITLSCVSFGRI